MIYHTERFTRGVISKIGPSVPIKYKGGGLSVKDIDDYSQTKSSREEKSKYFDLGSTIFGLIGLCFCVVMVSLLLLHLFFFKTFSFISIYFFIFLTPLIIGNIFSFKSYLETKTKKEQFFSKKSLTLAFSTSILFAIFVELLFFVVINFG